MAPTVASSTRNVSTERTTTISQNLPKQSKPLVPPQTKVLNTNTQQIQQKKAHRKPIIDWFQRKLGGTVKGKRTGDENLSNGNGRVSAVQRTGGRVVSSPIAGPGGRQQAKLDAMSAAAAARRKTVSLNGDDDAAAVQNTRCSDDDHENNSINESLAPDSVWSPNSLQEADEDASLRPLPPSSPPSPSPSRSSSSYLSDPRTFKSIAASTKPTTLLSIDLHGNGMAHIAQAPPTPTRFPHARSSSTTTNPNPLINGAVPPSPQTSSRPPSVQDILNTANTQASNTPIVQAPLHTTHHPRNNPRPLSPPSDDASVLTLASSAYAMPGSRVGGPGVPGWSSPPSAVGGGGDSMSHFGGNDVDAESTSQLVIDDERLDDRDVDASMRALRPRSTRRGSWESEVSRWSARIHITGPPSFGRERSLWTTNSVRTGTFSAENVDINDRTDSVTGEINTENVETEDRKDDEGIEDVASHPPDQSKAIVPIAPAENTDNTTANNQTTVTNEEASSSPMDSDEEKAIVSSVDRKNSTEIKEREEGAAKDKGGMQDGNENELEEKDGDLNPSRAEVESTTAVQSEPPSSEITTAQSSRPSIDMAR
ncbi:hypothetical protein E1B28_004536 [Marasmius oreades]|uniref:Uncharacterized protein n=1 Tax=Marasmius oreades TaxID=181124 RepID=A0A9P7UYS5_9AGAR|nr:uncharacterized protein E1B28_004536 [Marasmius oreades]KAG7097159.1 hypothetical protein E1B28_004536 [Marasmius oreades]